MKCPHCNVEINPDFKKHDIGCTLNEEYTLMYMICPSYNCRKFIIKLKNKTAFEFGVDEPFMVDEYESQAKFEIIYPNTSNRKAPKEVDIHIAQDFNESCAVLSYSKKASAALSRRCLQNIIREKLEIKKSRLVDEINEVIKLDTLSSLLKKSIDAIRVIGNFAAHPEKDRSTGEIIDIEDGEAEWLLDVLELMFEECFVKVAEYEKQRDKLNQKLRDLGKQPLL